MAVISSLVPARFLTLLAHLVIVVTIFWSRENNVLACLPVSYTQEQYNAADTQLIVALSVTLGMFVIEFAGFFSGVSMFNNSQSLLSVGAHASASVALLFYLFEGWQCSVIWWIFAFCRALAAHCSASVSLSLFVSQKWECTSYWYIFGFCSAFPAFTEIIIFIAVLGFKRKPL